MSQTKKWIGILSALMMASGVCFGQGQDDKVRSRLKEMKGDDDQAAMVAEMELLAMGDKALEPLKKIIDDGKDPQRAEAMKVYPRALEKAGRLTRVSLDYDNARFSDVIEGLNRQCKTRKFEVENTLSNSRITIHQEKIPYCLALAEVCQMADGMLIDAYTGKNGTIWREDGSKNRPISEDLGNVVILDSVSWRSLLWYGASDRRGPILTFSLKVMVDPSVQSIAGGVIKDVEARDESGNALSLIPSPFPQTDGIAWGMVRTRTLDLKALEGSKKIASLKGKAQELLGLDVETWSIDDASSAKGKKHEFGKIKVAIQSADLSDGILHLDLAASGIPRPRGFEPNDQNHHMFVALFKGAVQVESNDGKDVWEVNSISYSGLNPMGGSPNYEGDIIMVLRNKNDRSPKNVKLNVTLPRKIEETSIGFEFRDIQLF